MSEFKLAVLCFVSLALLIGAVVTYVKMLVKKNAEIKELKKQVNECYERIQKQMEIINGLETGSPDEQFDFSVDVLHDLAAGAKAKTKRP